MHVSLKDSRVRLMFSFQIRNIILPCMRELDMIMKDEVKGEPYGEEKA